MKTIFESHSIGDLGAIAQKTIDFLETPKVVCLYGNMGAGKTTFVKELLKVLEAKDHGNSPTFSLINTYESSNHGKIFHLDLYRLNSTEEALDIGVEDVLYDQYWCFIEWPEQITSLLPQNYANIKIDVDEEGTRIFSVEKKIFKY